MTSFIEIAQIFTGRTTDMELLASIARLQDIFI